MRFFGLPAVSSKYLFTGAFIFLFFCLLIVLFIQFLRIRKLLSDLNNLSRCLLEAKNFREVIDAGKNFGVAFPAQLIKYFLEDVKRIVGGDLFHNERAIARQLTEADWYRLLFSLRAFGVDFSKRQFKFERIMRYTLAFFLFALIPFLSFYCGADLGLSCFEQVLWGAVFHGFFLVLFILFLEIHRSMADAVSWRIENSSALLVSTIRRIFIHF